MKKILLAASLLAATAAHASIIPTLVDGPTSVGGGLYNYGYNATLASDQALFTGSYFTLYDFAGFDSVASLPANWSFTTANLGQTPSDVLPIDDPGILNITFTYTGPTLNFDDNPANNTELTFGTFDILSTLGGLTLRDFTSQAIKNDGPARGTDVSSIGSYSAPGAGGVVPEPASWAMLLAGFGLTGAIMRRRKRAASVTA